MMIKKSEKLIDIILQVAGISMLVPIAIALISGILKNVYSVLSLPLILVIGLAIFMIISGRR